MVAAASKLARMAGPRKRRSVTYDDNSNVIGQVPYVYDSLNRKVAYPYDNFDRPLTQFANLNGKTKYYYNGWRVVEEHDGADAIQQQYVWGNYFDEVGSMRLLF